MSATNVSRAVRAVLPAIVVAVVVCLSANVRSGEPPAAPPAVHPAALGATTRTPTPDEIAAYGLGPVKVRVRGRLVETVEKGGPAEKAGIVVGDALVALERNELYSADDVSDFLLVSREGRRVAAHLRRKGEAAERVVDVVLAASPETLPAGGIRWQLAGLGQYDDALAAAKKESKRVMVGLSGADT